MAQLGSTRVFGDLTVSGIARGVAKNYTTTIATTDSWSGTGPYTLVKTVTGITSDDEPIIDLDMSSATFANVKDMNSAWALIYRAVTSTDTITFYATKNVGSELSGLNDLVLNIKVVK